MKYKFLFLILFAFQLTQTWAYSKPDIVVAQDGSGNFRTVQDAINRVPNNQEEETVIYIKPGVYKEKLVLPFTKTHITLTADGNKSVIITYDDFASKKDAAGKDIGTSGSSSFYIYGAFFKAENLTFQNSSGPVGQAVAVWVGGDKAVFYNCRFLGFQDTLYTHSSITGQYYKDCYIEGTTDFIFGAATAWFEHCEIYCKSGGRYITAASTPDSVKYGYIFNKCTITGDSPDDSYYLGRPWRPYAKTVFINCYLSAAIKAEGWAVWHNKDDLKTTYYAEYKNNGKGFVPAGRVSWSYQLTNNEVKQYQIKNVLKGWNPL
jgi:pectinesterase